jgi:hypothetical protein
MQAPQANRCGVLALRRVLTWKQGTIVIHPDCYSTRRRYSGRRNERHGYLAISVSTFQQKSLFLNGW